MASGRGSIGAACLAVGLLLVALAGARAGALFSAPAAARLATAPPERAAGAEGVRRPIRSRGPSSPAADRTPDPQVLLGRYLVLTHLCGACHGGGLDPGAPGWLAGGDSFRVDGCRPDLVERLRAAGLPTTCYTTRARNLTPDNETGLGRFTERQIFNALRFGLRPEDTPDETITSTVPGQGNFPLHPHYLGRPMPWPDWRFMDDRDLRAIAAYLKRGLRPVNHAVAESDGPPDFWVGIYTAAGSPFKLGPYPAAAFPTANEVGSQATVTAPSMSDASPRDAGNPLGGDPSTFDQRVEAAMMRGDSAFFQAVLSPDVRFSHGNGSVWDKHRWLKFVPRFASGRRDLDSVTVERHGDVVETTGHIRVGAAKPGAPPLYQIWYVRVYGRREGVWQLLSNRTVREVDGPALAR